jgi:two-component system sensor histidine kinase KdpD
VERTRPNWVGGVVAGVVSAAVVTGALAPARGDVSRAVPALLLVLPVLVGGAAGGAIAAGVTAIVGAQAFNLVFIPPYGRLAIDRLEDWVAFGVFLAVAATVGWLVVAEGERRRVAEQREGELRELNERLHEMASREDALRAEASRAAVLAEIDVQRAALLRSVSHDLRSPLATIRAAASDLMDGATFDDATRAELLDLIGGESERLDRLVANLLALSRIEAGALRPDRQAVALDELVAETVRRLSRLFRQVRIQVEVPEDLPLVDADYSQLDQLLTNLLENASRYAPPRSSVRIAARAVDGDRSVELRVADDGIGVPDHERDRIFEPFRRGEGSRSSGIGLATCRAIVDAHGGTICVERTPGGGATFVVTLPAPGGLS